MFSFREREDLNLLKKIQREISYMRIFTTIFFSIAYILIAGDSQYFYIPIPFAIIFILSQAIRISIFNSPWIAIISSFLLSDAVVINTGFQRSPFIFLFLIPIITWGVENKPFWSFRVALLNTIFLTFLNIYAFIQRDGFGLAYVSGIILLMYWFLRIITRTQESLLDYATSMEEMAHIDQLTGLYNRRALEKYVNAMISRRNPFTLIMCDLDGFKRYNDVYGHQAGDDALRKFAELLKESLRPTDISFRYGGDEFVIVIQGELKNIGFLYDRIRDRLRERISDVGISFGSTLFPKDGNSLDKILTIADKALYEAKKLSHS